MIEKIRWDIIVLYIDVAFQDLTPNLKSPQEKSLSPCFLPPQSWITYLIYGTHCYKPAHFHCCLSAASK